MQENKALAEYRRIYHTKPQQVSRHKDDPKIKADFEIWKKQTKEKINQMKKGILTEDEVYQWVSRNK